MGWTSIFQSNLCHFMDELNLSETQLAKEIGITQKTISRYVSGTHVPKSDTLFALASRFNCTADDLWNYDFRNPNPEHPRVCARIPQATKKEFSYFEGKTLHTYYLREGSISKVYTGQIVLDTNYDEKRRYLHGHAKTGHEYDVKLVIEYHDNVYIYGISDEGERRFHLALFFPDFRDAPSYHGGVGVLTRLDRQGVLVAQRVVVSQEEIELHDTNVMEHLLKLLSDGEKIPRVWVNGRVDDEFRSGQWLD